MTQISDLPKLTKLDDDDQIVVRRQEDNTDHRAPVERLIHKSVNYFPLEATRKYLSYNGGAAKLRKQNVVEFSGFTVFSLDRNNEVAGRLDLTETFTFEQKDALYWDFSDNSAKKINLKNTNMPADSLLLLYYKDSQFCAGELLSHVLDEYANPRLKSGPIQYSPTNESEVLDNIEIAEGDKKSGRITFKNMRLYANNGFGKLLASYFGAAGQSKGFTATFTVPNKSNLVWYWDEEELVVEGNGRTGPARNPRSTILVGYKNRRFMYGEPTLLSLLVDKRRQNAGASVSRGSLNVLLSVGASHFGQSPIPVINGPRISLQNARIFAFDENYEFKYSEYDGSNKEGLTQTFEATSNGDTLVWEFDPESGVDPVRIVGFDNYPSTPFLPLAKYQDRQWSSAYIPQINIAQERLIGPNARLPETEVSIYKKLPGHGSVQALTQIGSQIWAFDAAAYDHSSNASIKVFDSRTFDLLYSGNHNVSHAPNVDYSPETQTLMISSGDVNPDVQERIDLFTGITEVSSGPHIRWDDSNRISIDLTVKDDSDRVIKSLHEYKSDGGALDGSTAVVFAGRKDMVWVFHNPHRGKHHTSRSFFLLLLGMGENDYSDPAGDDITRWGTFQSGKGDNQYNGTARVIEGPYFTFNQGFSQGFVYDPLEGELIMPMSRKSDRILEAMAFQPRRGGTVMTTKAWRIREFDSQGDVKTRETEGGVIIDGQYLLLGSKGDWFLFPMRNYMSGSGTVGDSIEYPFPGRAPTITPTNAEGAGCYISEQSGNGFTVSGPDGGTFNWSAPIS